MADAIISALTAASSLNGSDLIELEQGVDPANSSKKATLDQVKAFVAETFTAEEISYDNTTSGLTADQVQDAIDELASEAVISVVAGTNVTVDNTDPQNPIISAGGGGGGGAMTLVGTAIVAGSNATELTLSSLNLTTDGSYYLQMTLDNATASNAEISLLYNGDTTVTNYHRQLSYVAASSVGGARANNADIFTMDASETLIATATIFNDSDGKPRAMVDAATGPPGTLVVRKTAHARNVAANVTSITLKSSVASALKIGSTLKVFKVQ